MRCIFKISQSALKDMRPGLCTLKPTISLCLIDNAHKILQQLMCQFMNEQENNIIYSNYSLLDYF
jgi:hypothetical protein